MPEVNKPKRTLSYIIRQYDRTTWTIFLLRNGSYRVWEDGIATYRSLQDCIDFLCPDGSGTSVSLLVVPLGLKSVEKKGDAEWTHGPTSSQS